MKKYLSALLLLLFIIIPASLIMAKNSDRSGALMKCRTEQLVIFKFHDQRTVVARYMMNFDAFSQSLGTVLYSGTLNFYEGQQDRQHRVYSVNQDFNYSITKGLLRAQSVGYILHQGTTATFDELVRYVQPTLDQNVAGNYQVVQLGANVYAIGVNNLPRTRCVNTP